MKTKLQFNLEPLLLQLQAKNKRRYTYVEIAKKMSMRRSTMRTTIERIARNDSYQDLLALLSELLDFFAAEGMPITIDQLFTVQDVDDSEE